MATSDQSTKVKYGADTAEDDAVVGDIAYNSEDKCSIWLIIRIIRFYRQKNAWTRNVHKLHTHDRHFGSNVQ